MNEPAKPLIRFHVADGRVLIVGNERGMKLLADLASGAREEPYAEAVMQSPEAGYVICAMRCLDDDANSIDPDDPKIEAAVNRMVEDYSIDFQHDIRTEFKLI